MGKTVLLSEDMVLAQLPRKTQDLNKITAGKAYVVAGSRAFCGAAVLALSGVLRSGCGYVTLASTEYVCTNAAHHLVAPTFTVLPQTPAGRLSSQSAQTILTQAEGYDVLLVGCGLGHDADTMALVEKLLAYPKTILLDADGINAFAGRISLLKRVKDRLIITPHEGEMARLLGLESGWVQQNRYEAAQRLADESGGCVVLKGPHTLIVHNGQVLENTTGNSGLAKAGSGDLLAGIIASLVAQGTLPLWAAACGVYLHGAAADRTARRMSVYCMQPTDVLQDLPELFLKCPTP